MKASILLLTLSIFTPYAKSVCMATNTTREKWGDRTERLERERQIAEGTRESRKNYGNFDMQVWRPKVTAQPSSKMHSEDPQPTASTAKSESSRTLREEPMRKPSQRTSQALFYPADRQSAPEAQDEILKKAAVIMGLMPDLIEKNKELIEKNNDLIETNKKLVDQNEKLQALMERMFIGFDQKSRETQLAHTQTMLAYQAEANATIVQLQQQYVAQQEQIAQDNKNMRALIKERYEKIQATLAKLDQHTHKKTTL